MRGAQLRAVCTVVLVLGCAIYSISQAVNNAQIHGTITDPSGAAVVGARVTATQATTGLVRVTVTGGSGDYSLPNLPVGPYRLEVTAQGFQNYVQTGIVLQVSENPKVDVSLQVGTVTTIAEVHADASMVTSSDTSLSQVIDRQRVVDLPLDGRQLTDLILLSGAATNTSIPGNDLLSSKNYGNGNVTSSVTATISVAGGQQNSNNYVLDGGDHVDKFSNVNMPFPFPDAVQEYSVQTSTLTARYGAHPGSVVNVITKSGTNQWHGDIFDFLRNDAVNAHHWMAPSKTQTTALLHNDNALRRNQFGGTIGGPLAVDKLQFFAGYQGTRNFQMQAPTTIFVPTQAALNGDFSVLESDTCLGKNKGRTLKSPTTGKPFTGNQISPGLFNQQALNILKLVPVSTDPCGAITQSIPNTGDEDQGITRLDWNLSSKHTLFGRYFISDFRDPPIFDGSNLLTTTKAGQFARNQSAVIGETYTLGPTMVNSFHVTGNRMAIFRGPSANVPDPGALGINVPSPVPAALVVSISNYFNVESGTATPGHFNNNSLQVSDDFDWSHGKHQLAFGVNWIHSQLNELSTFQSDGQFSFSGSSGAGSTGDGLADFMLGALSGFTQGNNEQENWRQNYWGLYGQDNFRVRSNLTLNFGLRWEPYLPAKDRYHRGGHFDPAAFAAGTRSAVFPNAPPGLFFCGDVAQTPCSYVNSSMGNLSPRVGFNWDPRGKGKETIRGGFGLFYDNPEEFYFDRFADNSPFGSATTLSRPAGGLTNPYQGTVVPPFPLPFPTTQSSNAFFPPSGVYVNLPLNLRPTNVMTWNLSVDKQIGLNWLFSLSYLGNHTNHLWLGYDANAPLFIAGNDCSSSSTKIPTHGAGTSPCSTTANEQVRRLLNLQSPATGSFFSSISTATDEGNASYNALFFNVNHRLSHNFSLLANYTWSHCIDLGDFGGELSSSRLIANPNNFAADKGNCSFDVRHIVNTSLVASSPDWGHGITGMFLNNWQFSSIIGYRTGNHFSVLGGTDNSFTGIKQDRTDLVGDPNSGSCPNGSAVGSVGCWFNTSAFVVNPAGTFGTSGRNIIEGPGFMTFNAGISRQFKVRESQSLMLRFEAFNVLNHPNFANPSNSNPASTGFGTITTTLGTPRVLQLAAKYIF